MLNIFNYFDEPDTLDRPELKNALDLLDSNFKPQYKEILEPILPLLKKTPKYAYKYACSVLESRWHEAEVYIKKDPEYAYWYAKDVISGRWPEAEPYIMKDSNWAYFYARSILNKRWPEAEPVIKTDEYRWTLYSKYFKIY